MQNKSEINVTITQNFLSDTELVEEVFEGTLIELSEKLKDHVTDNYYKGWISVNFKEPIVKKLRLNLVEGLQQGLKSKNWQKPKEGDRGERITIDSTFSPSFALSEDEDSYDYIVGFWYTDTSFLLYASDISKKPDGEGVSIMHWHPDSRCSGAWQDSYSFISDSLAISHTLNDDDGYYIEFIAGNFTTPSSKAVALDTAVYAWDLYLAEHRLLQAYFLGFTGGDIGLLCGENEGYEIEYITVNLSSSVLEKLQVCAGEPSKEDAIYWLDILESTLDSDDYVDHPLTINLRKIADGKASIEKVGG